MRNKILLIIMIIFSFTLISCKKKEVKPLAENEYYIYYINTNMNTLVESRYSADAERYDTQALVNELMTHFLKVPDDLEAMGALSDKVTYQGFNIDGNILYLNFDTNYQGMEVSREVLARAALAKTLIQIDGIEYISIRSGEQPLLNARGENVGLISSTNFINSVSNINSFEKATLLLYFSDESGTKLVAETRDVFYDLNTSKERLIVDELIKGPFTTSLKATIPSDTKVISVTMNEGICYVNFDEGFLNSLSDVLDSITIYSIVDSLSEMPNVSRVQILVNGKSDKNYNTISLGTSVERNLDYLKEE
ncbi:GerMN domain-containing protein [Lachnoanaerobaculum sp. Marseille-Q4761]|uniref:GerMN domain-containing protein n=1 Tax=Lachnoanaerobaculum sp. Marseille-Q4761 TaxID=2819511 RepID=UPI001AA0E590|nr:GerMN domain-containing protein [Lachnoanaerobaculum sp. Marseille-Q4761]